MTEYLQYFFDPGHLFSLRPPAMSVRAVTILAVIFGLWIVASIIGQMMSKKIKDGLKRKGYIKISRLGMVMGLIGFVYLFFAYQGVTLLAARFWLILWALTTAVWAGFIIKYMAVNVPKMRKNIESKKNFEKYIPK